MEQAIKSYLKTHIHIHTSLHTFIHTYIIISKGLYIMNEESERTTFHNARGKSNIDLTIGKSQILQDLINWEICVEDSCSDHSIIKFCIVQHRNQDKQQNNGIRYIINEQTLSRFERNLIISVATKFQKGKITDFASLDNELATQTKETHEIEKAVDKPYKCGRQSPRKSIN